MAIDNIKKNLSKTGSTAYEVTGFDISLQSVKFIPNSIISEKRKELTSLLDKRRIENHVRDFRIEENAEYPYPDKNIGHEGNVHNHLAKSFLEQHGASLIEPSFELQHRNDVSLMTCQHCIKRIIGLCSKNGHIANSDLKPYINDGNFTEPFYLSTASGVKLKLEFDCKNCEMKVYRS